MNKQECLKILAYISGVYPRYYSNADEKLIQRQAAVWTDLLGGYSSEDVFNGVRAYCSADASGFPPTPGQIIEHMYRLANPTNKTGAEAWALVRRAVNASGWDLNAAYEVLPEMVKRALGDRQALRSMALMDRDKLETVAQSNFLRTYEALQRRAAIEDKYKGMKHIEKLRERLGGAN